MGMGAALSLLKAEGMQVAGCDMREAVRAEFAAYGWPGNVRELRNTIERALILGRFTGPGQAAAPAQALAGTLAEIEQRAILSALAACEGDREAAAARLGISRKTIDRRLQDWHGAA